MGVLVLVRHGQASFLSENYDQLSPLGKEQARHLGEYLVRHDIAFDEAYTGPLHRQRDTGAIVARSFHSAGRAFPEVQVLDGLMEFPAEPMAMKFFPRLVEENAQVREWLTQFQAAPDVAEKSRYFQKAFEVLLAKWADGVYRDDAILPWTGFVAKVNEALRFMTADKPKGRRIIAFTSGGVTAVALHRALDTSADVTTRLAWMLRNGALTEFLFTNGRFTLSAFNDVPHMPSPDLWTFR